MTTKIAPILIEGRVRELEEKVGELVKIVGDAPQELPAIKKVVNEIKEKVDDLKKVIAKHL